MSQVVTLPPVNDTLVGPLVNRLHLVSFTGSHGVGKSTTANRLSSQLNNESPSVSAVVCPSCATKWFTDQQALTPELKVYDDLDRIDAGADLKLRFGQHTKLRLKMQLELPALLRRMLCELVQSVLEKNANSTGVETYVLVDRWFTDIAAYTSLKLPGVEAASVQHECQHQSRQLFEWLMHASAVARHQLYLTHVLIPAKTCLFTPNDDKPNRGTDSATEWERHAEKAVLESLYPARVFSVTKSSLQERLDEIWARVRVPYENKSWLNGKG